MATRRHQDCRRAVDEHIAPDDDRGQTELGCVCDEREQRQMNNRHRIVCETVTDRVGVGVARCRDSRGTVRVTRQYAQLCRRVAGIPRTTRFDEGDEVAGRDASRCISRRSAALSDRDRTDSRSVGRDGRRVTVRSVYQ